MISKLYFLVLPLYCFSQTITGTITDASTNLPLATVAIYFDNTTVGTTTNEKGKFSLAYTDAIQSGLVISYLGYEKVIINKYRGRETLNIALKPSAVILDEVNLDYDDGLTRKQKLRLFKKEFLGTSKYGKSCKISNEDDIILQYDKESKTLSASVFTPIVITNKALQYEISFDIIEFEANYSYVNIETQDFAVKRVSYFGTSYYKDLQPNKKRIKRKRENVYKGSVQHFMRALYNKKLSEEKYEIYFDKFKVDAYAYFKISDKKEDSGMKTVSLEKKVSILYTKKLQSAIDVFTDNFLLDVYGNYSPIQGVYFYGAMGNQRLGDALPLDYGL